MYNAEDVKLMFITNRFEEFSEAVDCNQVQILKKSWPVTAVVLFRLSVISVLPPLVLLFLLVQNGKINMKNKMNDLVQGFSMMMLSLKVIANHLVQNLKITIMNTSRELSMTNAQDMQVSAMQCLYCMNERHQQMQCPDMQV